MEKSKYPSTVLSIQLFCFISVSALDSWHLLHVFDIGHRREYLWQCLFSNYLGSILARFHYVYVFF